ERMTFLTWHQICSRLLLFGQKLMRCRGAFLLAPAGWAWGGVARLKNSLYDWGVLRPARVPSLVISVGNIIAGGTGKTPFTLLLAQTLSHRQVAVLSRGYGAVPDEALLLRRRLPSAKIYIGKDRVELAKRAAQEGAEVILLDDGFQHRRLTRDFDVVLTKEPA